jgi:hypothetical protein
VVFIHRAASIAIVLPLSKLIHVKAGQGGI